VSPVLIDLEVGRLTQPSLAEGSLDPLALLEAMNRIERSQRFQGLICGSLYRLLGSLPRLTCHASLFYAALWQAKLKPRFVLC